MDDFLRRTMRSGLLDRDQLRAALRTLAKEQRDQVPALVDHLIGQRRLTRFQAHKLVQGITFGLVLGPYHILTPIGRGGMGTVYLALDTRTGQYVALKILPPKLARSAGRLLARFRREMELSQKVSHPQIARTLDAGVQQNVHFLAMEYIPGQTLYRLVTTKGTLNVPRAAHLFAEAAAGLVHAHRQGLIHRDLKPSNIMVTPLDHAKVLDLGLAYSEGEEAEDIEVVGGRGYIVGSIDYMAPEQTRDPTNIDARADLYALGCCLYFALTGKPPFPGGTIHDKVRAHRHEAPEPIQERNSLVPAAFAAIVQKMMAKSPDDRFNSATEVEKALRAWAADAMGPLDTQDDATYQQAVQQVIDTWTAAEPSTKESPDDAIIFRIDSEDKPAALEPTSASASIFSEIDPRMRVGIVVAFIIWCGLLTCSTLACCIFAANR